MGTTNVTSTFGTIIGSTSFQYKNGYLANVRAVHNTIAGQVVFDFNYDTPAPAGSGQTQPSIVTGVDPSEIANALYGKIIPLSALGLARIGTAGLIFGPYFNAGAASFAVSFGFPVNPAGERRVYEIALDGKVAWELGAGSPAGALDPSGFISPPFQCRFYSGTQTQAADPLEAAMFGDEAVAYRPQMMLWFSDLPVADFDGRVPFVSAKIGDVTGGAVPADGLNLGEVLERIAYSPWLEYDSGSFEATGTADIVQAMILTEDQSFLDLLRTTSRFYRTLDILQTDMLRVNDRGSVVTPDVILHRDHITVDAGVQYFRAEEASVPRELEFMTIDPDADYVFMPGKAMRPLYPVPVTASVGKESVTLPVVVDANTRMSLVTYTKYQEENARKRVSLQTLLYGYALEPGDLFRLTDVADGFDNSEVWKVVETSHGANYINEINAEAILKCTFETAPLNVILLLHAEALVDSSTYDDTVVLIGGAHIDTTIKKFGASSFAFDGAGDGVDAGGALAPQYQFSPTNTSPYTIELWARFDTLGIATTQHQALLSQNTFAQRAWILYVPVDTNELTFATSSNGSGTTAALATSGAGLLINTWHHIAVDKDSTGTVRIYVDGVMKASSTPADSVIFHSSYPIGVGRDAAGLYPFAGNIDDVRILGGSQYGDLYGNSSFSPPSSQFPDP